MVKMLKKFVLSACNLLVISPLYAGANFTISPAAGYPLPTQVNAGKPVSAFYTVLNNTHSLRAGYSVQGLSAAVLQNTTNTAYCANPISLAANSSCLLRLDISAAIQSNFAICKGASCTTATTPLNVVQGPGTLATAVGFYNTSSNYSAPLAYISYNAGLNWNLSAPLTLPADVSAPLASVTNRLASLICDSFTGLNCTAVGSYTNNLNNIVPLTYTSTNGGNNWVLNGRLQLPINVATTLQNTLLLGMTCNNATAQNCVTVGQYATNESSTLPLYYKSSNGGNIWSLMPTVPLPSDATTTAQVALMGAVACDEQMVNCIASGVYKPTTNIHQIGAPIVFTSSDGASS